MTAFVAVVVPQDLVQVDASEGGRIADIYVSAGDLVRAGQTIMRLENAERELLISSRVSQIQADINALRSQEGQIGQARLADRKAVLEAQYALQKAKAQFARRQILADKGVLGPAHLAPNLEEVQFYQLLVGETEKTETANEVLRAAQLASLAEQFADLDQNLQSARAQVKDFLIVAPRDGMIIGLAAKKGATVAAGAQVAELDPQKGLMLEAEIDQYYASRIKVGMQALVASDQGAALTVTRVSPNVQDGAVRIELAFADGTPPHLKAGETVQGRLTLAGDVQAVAVPNGPFMSETNGRYIFVLSADGQRAERRPIRVGVRTPDQIAVLDGLAEGERVIVSDYESFANADTIGIR